MLSLHNATKEKENIKMSIDDSSRMYFKNIFRYVNITEYQAVSDNLSFFLKICPKSMDISKNLEYWKYLKGYLKGLRYIDDDLKNKIENEELIIRNLNISSTEIFYSEIRRFLETVFIPTWLSKWEKK